MPTTLLKEIPKPYTPLYDFARDHDLSVSDLGFQLLIPHIGSITIRAAPRLHRDDRHNHRPGCFQCPSLCLFALPLTSPPFCFPEIIEYRTHYIFNLFFLVVCPVIYKNHPDLISWFYRPDYGRGIFWFPMCRFLRIVVVADS